MTGPRLARPDEAAALRDPPARWPSLVPWKAGLIALPFALAAVIVPYQDVQDLLITWRWGKADAVIDTEPVRGDPMNKRGYAYVVTFRLALPDGRTIRANSIRPLFTEAPAGGTPGTKVAPRLGDRMPVYFDPRQPEQVVPAREMLRASPLLSVLAHLLVFALLWSLMFRLLTGAQLRRT